MFQIQRQTGGNIAQRHLSSEQRIVAGSADRRRQSGVLPGTPTAARVLQEAAAEAQGENGSILTGSKTRMRLSIP